MTLSPASSANAVRYTRCVDVRVRARVGDHRAAVGVADEHDRTVDRVERGAEVVAVGVQVGPGSRSTDGLSTAAVAKPCA